LICDKFRAVRKILRKLLVLTLAAWLPVFAGSALASVVCKDPSAFDHAQPRHAHMGGHADASSSSGAESDCEGCSLCYSHCTLWMSATAYGMVMPAPSMSLEVAASHPDSISFPPADRPPLARFG
jgi:hypothetical protein